MTTIRRRRRGRKSSKEKTRAGPQVSQNGKVATITLAKIVQTFICRKEFGRGPGLEVLGACPV